MTWLFVGSAVAIFRLGGGYSSLAHSNRQGALCMWKTFCQHALCPTLDSSPSDKPSSSVLPCQWRTHPYVQTRHPDSFVSSQLHLNPSGLYLFDISSIHPPLSMSTNTPNSGPDDWNSLYSVPTSGLASGQYICHTIQDFSIWPMGNVLTARSPQHRGQTLYHGTQAFTVLSLRTSLTSFLVIFLPPTSNSNHIVKFFTSHRCSMVLLLGLSTYCSLSLEKVSPSLSYCCSDPNSFKIYLLSIYCMPSTVKGLPLDL